MREALGYIVGEACQGQPYGICVNSASPRAGSSDVESRSCKPTACPVSPSFGRFAKGSWDD